MRRSLFGSLSLMLLGTILLSLLMPISLESQDESDFIQQLIDGMAVDEKVGQLFLVTFAGSELGPESDVAELITEYRVGGVMFLADNGNFTNGEDTPRHWPDRPPGVVYPLHW